MAAIAMPYLKATNGTDYTDKKNPTESNLNNGSNASSYKNGNGQPKVTYEDPDADVALRSNEGRIFKVESYVLKTHSSHFRQLFKTGVPHDPIPIDASTKILKGLLDIMHMRPVPSGMVWAYKDKLLKLCDQLGTPSVAERAVFSMHENVHKDPWGVFALASQRSNLPLAKSALKHLADGDEGAKIDKLTPQLAAGVTLPYLLGLFNAALSINNDIGKLDHSSDDGQGHSNGGSLGWKAIAERFAPVMG